MNNAKSPPLIPVELSRMRGLYTEARPEQLPEGASPLSINCEYIVGSVIPRPGLQGALTAQTAAPPPPPPTSPAFVQSAHNSFCQCCNPALTSFSTAFVSNNAAGNVIVVVFSFVIANRAPDFDKIDLFTISDTNGNVYTRVQTELNTSNNGVIVWFATNIKAGANTVTVAVSAAVPPPYSQKALADGNMVILEYSPGALPFVFDQSNGNDYETVSNGNVVTTGQITPAKPVALLVSFAFSSFSEIGDTITFTPSAGWTVREGFESPEQFTLYVADKVVTATAVQANAWVYNSLLSESDVVDTGIASYLASNQGAGGAGGGPLVLPVDFNYIKTFAEQAGEISTLLLDSTGTMWKEDVVNNQGVIVPIYTAIEPNTFGQSATVDDREFIALSDLKNGTDIPYTYNGTNFDRLSQVGPGSAPIINFLQSQFPIVAAPNGITQPPPNAGVVGTNAAPGFFQAVDWANAAPTGRSPGNILTIFYAQDAADPLAIVGNVVQLSGMNQINGQNPNGTYTIIANGFDFPSGDAGAARYWFAVSVETVNNQFIGGPNTESGNYQITKATVTTTVPVPNIVIGSQITIVGAGIPRWDSTWTVIGTPTSGQFAINQTSLTNDVASYQYTLLGGSPPVVGQQITIIGCTNGPLVNGGSIFNVQNAVVTAVSPSSFSIALRAANVLPASENGSATTSGTQFNFDPGPGLLGSVTDAGYQPAIFGNSGGGSVLGVGTISQGLRKICYSFLTRNGYLTKPSPIATVEVPAGASSLIVSGLLSGPLNVIARVVHITPANGGNFYNIPEPVSVNVGGIVTLNQSTWLRDNTSSTISLSFSDGVLLAADEIDIQGNNLFETAEVGSSLGVIPYASRLALIREQNKLTNLLNWSFDGGIAPSNYPAGWTQDPVFGGGGSVQTSPIFGFGYQIANSSGMTQPTYGMIYQGAFQDEFQVPIVEASTTYSVRITAALTAGIGGAGSLSVDLFDPSSARILGQFTVPFSSLAAGMQIFSGTMLTTPLAPVPSGLLLRVYATNMPTGVTVMIDRVEAFPTEQPNLATQVSLSYVNNFEAVDQVTGVVDTAIQNQQPVRSAFTLYDTLYLVKSNSLVAVQDNGTTEPAGWTVRMISSSVGTPSIYGATSHIDEPEGGEQWALIANQNGLYYFDGGQPLKISGEIEKLWKKINWAYGHTIWLKNDVINRRIYVGVPLKTPNQWLPTGIIPDNSNPTQPNVILMLNYKQLQSGEALADRPGVHASAFTGKLLATEITRAWSIWTIAAPAVAFITRNDQTAPLFIANEVFNGKVYQLIDDFLQDDGVAFAQIYDTYGFISPEQDEALRMGQVRKMFDFMRLLITGSGDLTVTVYPNTLDTPYAHALVPDLILPGSTNGDLEYPLNEAGERLFLQFKCFAVGAGFYLSRITIGMSHDPWTPVRGRNV